MNLLSGCNRLVILGIFLFVSIFANYKIVYADIFVSTGSMGTARQSHTATLLPNGKVLMAGGNSSSGSSLTALATAELYDPATGTFSPTGSMGTARQDHTATLLPNGKVLVAGGRGGSGVTATAELYDPVTGTFSPTGSMGTARYGYASATLLSNGKVLITGGVNDLYQFLSTAELYDPATGSFAPTGAMGTERHGHTATLLPNGKVLVAGGYNDGGSLSTAELYDPTTGIFNPTGAMATARHAYSATLLPNGKVLVAGGGTVSSDFFASAELYDPATGNFSPTGSMGTARTLHTATLLPNGKVLVAGGHSGIGFLATAELYDPATGTFSATGSMETARYYPTATLLNNGKVLVAGGDAGSSFLDTAELYGFLPIQCSSTVGLPGSGSFFTVDVPGSLDSIANGINDCGDIVGDVHDENGYHGYLFDGSAFTILDFPGATFTRVSGINNSGQIVGYYNLNGQQTPGMRSFIYQNGTYTDLESSCQLDANSAVEANGINDLGDIVGGYIHPDGRWRGFLCHNGSFTKIDVLESVFNINGTSARGINNLGQIVGTWANNDCSCTSGFLYEGGTYKTLFMFGQAVTEPMGINDHGQIVGLTWGPPDANTVVWHGFVYDGITYSLLDVPGSGQAAYAYDINNTLGNIPEFGLGNVGEIVGRYDDSKPHGFLITSGLVPLTVLKAGTGAGTVTSAPPGIDCGTACVASFTAGDSVELTATADEGSNFTGWSGADAAECTAGSVLMNAAKSCTANFTLNTYTLSIATMGTGSGTVSGAGAYNAGTTATVSATADVGSVFTGWVDPNAVECTTGAVLMNADKICTANFTINTYILTLSTGGSGSGMASGGGTYNYGATATLTATANAGSTFTGWTGSDAAECTAGSVVMNANKSCTANFTLNTYTLALSTEGTGSGTVSGAGIYIVGTIVPLTAMADPGSTFAGWSGVDAGECATGSVVMIADKSCTATFTLNTYALTLDSAGAGSGTVLGAGTYNSGQTAIISATADVGSTFVGWSGADAAECASGSVVMVADKSCTATFTLNTYTLTITTAGTGSGSVSTGGTYDYGYTATVAATADAGSTFSGWSGPDAAECATGSVLMNANKSCTATFTLNTYTLSLAMAGTGSGTVSGGGSYDYGTTATVTATAAAGSTFDGWTGSDAADCAAGSVTMNADKSCTATFTLIPPLPTTYTLTLSTAGTGSGTITGAGTYNSSDTATVSAMADVGSTFSGWIGTAAAECATGSVLMNADKSCTATFTVTTSVLPDLIVSKVSAGILNIKRNAGGNFNVSDTVTNVGGSQAAKFVVAYHLSSDMIYGNGDDVVSATTRTVISLAAGASNTWNPTVVYLPTTTPPGIYHLCAKADDDITGSYAVTESNEDNNWACAATTIEVPKPDLDISQVSLFTYSVNAGGTMAVLDSLTNKGGSPALAFDVGYVLSANSVIGDSDDILLPTTRTLDVLGVGATSTASTHVTIPEGVPPGEYYVGAIADVNGAVDESNETNNTGRASSKITVIVP